MPIYTDKRTGRLFVQFDYLSQTYKRYLPKGSTRSFANQVEVKMRSEAFAKAHGIIPPQDVLFEDFVLDTFLPDVKANLSAEGYTRAENICVAAKPFLKGKTLRNIKPFDIDRFKIHRMNELTPHGKVRKPATVWRELSILSALFSLAIREDVCEKNPVNKIEKPSFDNIQTTVLAREHEASFLANFDQKLGQMARDICVLVLNTGLRQNDVLNLSDFHIRENEIHLVQGKTKRLVIIPLNQTALQIVAKYSGNGLLFPNRKSGKPMHYIRTAIAGACRRSEIPALGIRDLRRTFATRLAEDGVDALTIALLLGHSDLRMVHRYARSTEAMRKAVEKLGNPTQNLPLPQLRMVK